MPADPDPCAAKTRRQTTRRREHDRSAAQALRTRTARLEGGQMLDLSETRNPFPACPERGFSLLAWKKFTSDQEKTG